MGERRSCLTRAGAPLAQRQSVLCLAIALALGATDVHVGTTIGPISPTLASDQPVVAVMPIKPISITRTTPDEVGATTASQLISSTSAEQTVGTGRSEDGVITRLAPDLVHMVFKSSTCVYVVRPGTTLDEVVATSTADGVGATER